MKKLVGLICILAVLLGCTNNVVFAADMGAGIALAAEKCETINIIDMDNIALCDTQVIYNTIESKTRATGAITWDIPSGYTGKGNTSFPLEAGESVTFNFSYTPRSASVDFGLIAPNGRYYYISGENGSINREIKVY